MALFEKFHNISMLKTEEEIVPKLGVQDRKIKMVFNTGGT